MSRLCGTIVCAGVALGLCSGMALAIPPVLEKSPQGAMMVIAIPNAERFEKSVRSLMTSAEMDVPFVGVEEMLIMTGVGGAGVDLSRSLALVVMPPEPGAAREIDLAESDFESRAVVMVPVSDYAAFLDNFDAKPGVGGAAVSFDFNGKDGFARDLGDGYAVLSANRAMVEGFKGGNPTLKADMGKLGERIADNADIVVVVNMAAAGPSIKRGIAGGIEQMADRVAGMGIDVAGGGESPVVDWISEAVVADAKVFVGGLKTGGLGVSLDMAASFKEGSMMARTFAAAGDSQALLSRLPNTQYLFAAAMDLGGAGLKDFIRTASAKAKDSAPAGMPSLFDGATADADGHSVVIGMNPTMLMGGGVFTNTASFTATSDPDAVIAGIRKQLDELAGKSVEGMTFDSSYKEGGAKVGDQTVDVWQIKIQPDGGDPMQMQATALMFGPGGPGGYIAKAPGGVVRTYGKNQALMAAALKAAGNGDNLGSDALLKQVGGQLPSGRVAEFYLGTKNILDMLLPAAVMFGVQIDPDDFPAQLPPIGLGLSGEGGSAHFSVFIPAPVLKVANVLAEALGPDLMGLGDEDWEDDVDEEEPTGQPRF